MRGAGLPQGWRAARYGGMLQRMEEAGRLTEEERERERAEEISRMWSSERHGRRGRRGHGGSPWRGLERRKATRHRPWVVSQDAIARAHGAEVVYLVGEELVRPLPVDLLVWTVRELLGYRQGPPVWEQPRLGRAVREVLLHWPPMEFRDAVHEVVWQVGCDPLGQRGGGRDGVTVTARLRRARRMLEAWHGRRLVVEMASGGGVRCVW